MLADLMPLDALPSVQPKPKLRGLEFRVTSGGLIVRVRWWPPHRILSQFALIVSLMSTDAAFATRFCLAPSTVTSRA